MRCATYPPPPGSAPGYQEAHQVIETYTRNVIIGIQAEFRSGTKLKTDPCPPPLAWRAASIAASFVFIASIPPTAWTANTASAMTMLILITNRKTSVTNPPHKPDNVEMNEVSAIMPTTTTSACHFSTPRISQRIS